MNKIILNNRGFSLLEVVMALGLMAMASLGFMRLQEQVTKQEVSSSVRFDEQNLFGSIIRLLRTNNSCNFMIGSYCDDLSDKTNPLACTSSGANWVTGVPLGNYSGQADVTSVKDSRGLVMFEVGKNYGKSTLKSITVYNNSQADGGAPTGGIGKGKLELVFLRDNKMFVGAAEQKRFVDISIKLEADNTIKRCVSSGFDDIIPTDRLYININQTSPTVNANGEVFSANCDTGDLLIGGDCIQFANGAANYLVQGDPNLIISGSPNCSGCPNDAANCEPQCFNNEYSGYSCYYANANVIYYVRPDNTAVSLNSVTSSDINIEPGSKLRVVQRTYQQMGGTSARGARAICLDRD